MPENENLEIWSKNPLADLSQLLLLLLINHSSSSALIAEAPAVPEDHCYRLALYHCYSHKGKYFYYPAMICFVCIFAKYLVKSSSALHCSALISEAPTVPEDHCYSHKGTQIPSRIPVYHNNLGKR